MRLFVMVIFIFGLCLPVGILPLKAVSAQTPLPADSAEIFQKMKELKASFKDSPKALEEIGRLKKKYPEQSGKPKYERSGHQFTTYITAMAAGLESDRSYELSYFSQFPDDEIWFSATLAFFYIHDLEYRKQIMAVLHSLHGGGNSAVLKRRSDLKDLIQEGIKNKSLEDYQIGLIIHAFADSYAHTTIEDGHLKAFNYTWGHLFHGHKPDIIAYDPERYKNFTCELYKALSLKLTCYPQLDTLHSMIKKLEKSRNAELPKFVEYAKDSWDYDQDQYDSKGEEVGNVVTMPEVINTIKVIEAQISE